MQCSFKQRYTIKFCVGLRKLAIETLAMMLKAFENESLSKAVVLRRSKTIAMLIVFFDANDVVNHEFVPERHTIMGAFYEERLKGGISRVRSGTVSNWKLHHDKVPIHTCFIVNDYLA